MFQGKFVYVMKAGVVDVSALLQEVRQGQFAEFMYHHMMQMVGFVYMSRIHHRCMGADIFMLRRIMFWTISAVTGIGWNEWLLLWIWQI